VDETGFIETGRRNCDHCGKEMAAWKDMHPLGEAKSSRDLRDRIAGYSAADCQPKAYGPPIAVGLPRVVGHHRCCRLTALAGEGLAFTAVQRRGASKPMPRRCWPRMRKPLVS
jgi:hypothetical protein